MQIETGEMMLDFDIAYIRWKIPNVVSYIVFDISEKIFSTLEDNMTMSIHIIPLEGIIHWKKQNIKQA